MVSGELEMEMEMENGTETEMGNGGRIWDGNGDGDVHNDDAVVPCRQHDSLLDTQLVFPTYRTSANWLDSTCICPSVSWDRRRALQHDMHSDPIRQLQTFVDIQNIAYHS